MKNYETRSNEKWGHHKIIDKLGNKATGIRACGKNVSTQTDYQRKL